MVTWTQITDQPLFIPNDSSFSFEKVASCPEAKQVVYSPYHNALLIRSTHTLYKVSLDSYEKTIVYGSDTYEILFLAASLWGDVMLLLRGEDNYVIKIFHRDLFRIQMELTTIYSVPTIGWFWARGKAVCIVELLDSGTARFLALDFVKKKINQNIVEVAGPFIAVFPQTTEKYAAFSTGGEIFEVRPEAIKETYVAELPPEQEQSSSSSSFSEIVISDEFSESSSSVETDKDQSSESSFRMRFIGVELIGELGKNIVSVGAAGKKVTAIDDIQKKIRVFVGSKPWQNDRWDSGEIETDKSSIAYGGGNNLMPGQKYFAHVLVNYQKSGWSSPQIFEFVVPRYEGE